MLDAKTQGCADFRGNLHYISAGNLGHGARMSIVPMDYANQQRPNLQCRVRVVDVRADPVLIERRGIAGYKAKIERALMITVEGHDWNCPQHITPHVTEAAIESVAAPPRETPQRRQGRATKRRNRAYYGRQVIG